MSDVDERVERLLDVVNMPPRHLDDDAHAKRVLTALVEELGITSEMVRELREIASEAGIAEGGGPWPIVPNRALTGIADALDTLLRAARPTEPPTP
jgi:hypothetical protein